MKFYKTIIFHKNHQSNLQLNHRFFFFNNTIFVFVNYINFSSTSDEEQLIQIKFKYKNVKV